MGDVRGRRRVALVTGGRSGIGAAVVASLRAAGWRVASLGRKPAESDDPNYLALVGDVAEWQDVVDAAHTTIDRLGEIDFVFAGAGVLEGGGVGRGAEKSWLELIDTNLTGAFNTVDATADSLRKTGGRVVFVSSIAIQQSRPGLSAYTAAKAGVKAMAECFAAEVESKGVGVTTLVLGPTDTPMLDRPGADPHKLDISHVVRTIEFILSLPSDVAIPELALRAAAPRRGV